MEEFNNKTWDWNLRTSGEKEIHPAKWRFEEPTSGSNANNLYIINIQNDSAKASNPRIQKKTAKGGATGYAVIKRMVGTPSWHQGFLMFSRHPTLQQGASNFGAFPGKALVRCVLTPQSWTSRLYIPTCSNGQVMAFA